jgi:hypothetical protein
MTQEQIDKALAAAKIAVGYIAGGMTTLGVQTMFSPADVATDVNHMLNGIQEFCVGAGPLVTLAMGWWATRRASLASKVASVQAADPAALVQAVQTVSPITLRNAVAAQPDVKKVTVTTQAAADASPSPKVST